MVSHNSYDLEGYLSDLLAEIDANEKKREYEFVRPTTEFYLAIRSFDQVDNLETNQLSVALSSRLLDKEVDTDSRYSANLGRTNNQIVKRGSFLQFLYNENGTKFYLGVKIDHAEFIDEKDFRKKLGLAISRKIYKACKVSYSSDGTPNQSIYVYDTNSKPTVYWWKDFLELKQIRNDSNNTRTAVGGVISIVNGYKKKYPADHTSLKNAVIIAFKQDSEMDYNQFVCDIFESYRSDDPEFQERLPRVIERLRELPEKEGFDTQFNLVPSEVNFRKTKIRLTPEIDLSYEDAISNLDSKIWAEESSSGEKLVVISSPEGYKKFTKKERV